MFRDEDIEYAPRLLRAGVPTELHVYPGGVPRVGHGRAGGGHVGADGAGAHGRAARGAASAGRRDGLDRRRPRPGRVAGVARLSRRLAGQVGGDADDRVHVDARGAVEVVDVAGLAEVVVPSDAIGAPWTAARNASVCGCPSSTVTIGAVRAAGRARRGWRRARRAGPGAPGPRGRRGRPRSGTRTSAAMPAAASSSAAATASGTIAPGGGEGHVGRAARGTQHVAAGEDVLAAQRARRGVVAGPRPSPGRSAAC